MRYKEAVSLLLGLSGRAMQPGLGRMRAALEARGHPERAFESVIVGGTNGKGSVAAMVAAGLAASGHKVGLFTSPHLHRLVERFRVGGRTVSERRLADKVGELSPWLLDPHSPQLTFFEACTLVALELFRDAGCELSVLEVGLGGRLDATNVVRPRLSVITSVGLDHQEWLGNSLREVAREKAGIIWEGVPVISGVRAPEPRAVIARRARTKRAPIQCIDRDFSATPAPGGYRVVVGEQTFERISLPLAGAHQADNLACAASALIELSRLGVSLDPGAWGPAMRRVRWPGRLERISSRPVVLLDAAHNPAACEMLARHLGEIRGEFARVVLLFGVLRDKDHPQMLALLRERVDRVVFSQPSVARARPAVELAADFDGEGVVDPVKAFRRARRLAGPRGLVVVAGSIFLLAPVRASLLGLRADPPVTL